MTEHVKQVEGRKERRGNKKRTKNARRSAKEDDDVVTGESERREVFQGIDELNSMDDWGSAWQDAKEKGEGWGGRGKGGRGIQRNTFQPKDVYVEGVTLAYQGVDLLERTTLRLGSGKRYGLVGPNGIGKTTLLRRMAAQAIPGFPLHLRSYLVQQEELEGSETSTVLDTVLASDTALASLRQEAEILESACEPSVPGSSDAGVRAEDTARDDRVPMDLEEQINRLQEIYEELEIQGAHGAEGRALSTLKGLGFSDSKISQPTKNLSGGWMMRLALACALQCCPDILLLDEPTNHLDLEGVLWLQQHLQQASETTVVLVSHNAAFLDAVSTDIIHFHQKGLHYYPGNYSEFQKTKMDKDAFTNNSEDALGRQRKHMELSVKKMEKAATGKGGDQKKLGQVASRKKKLDRHGLEKNIHGHRFKCQHNVYLDGSSIRQGAVNENALGWKNGKMTRRSVAAQVDRETVFRFPEVDPLPCGPDAPLVQCRDVFFSFSGSGGNVGADNTKVSQSNQQLLGGKGQQQSIAATRPLLEGVNLDLTLKSRVVLLGHNGSGKSTLLRLIADAGEVNVGLGSGGEREPLQPTKGQIAVYRNTRMGLFTQRHQEKLNMTQSPLQHLTQVFPSTNEEDLRKQLGSCGICGDLALMPIGTLSGGQKSRVVLSELMLHRPHILLLDEPTNHLDMPSIDALKEALCGYSGGVVLVSHDQGLITDMVDSDKGELWTVYKRRVERRDGGMEEYITEVEERLSRKGARGKGL